VLRGLTFAVALLASPSLLAGQTAATLYALNCRGCHLPPEADRTTAPRRIGQFAQTEAGRVFFIELPDPAVRLTRAEDARLLREILDWKRSCYVILQDAPLIRYDGGRFVK